MTFTVSVIADTNDYCDDAAADDFVELDGPNCDVDDSDDGDTSNDGDNGEDNSVANCIGDIVDSTSGHVLSR